MPPQKKWDLQLFPGIVLPVCFIQCGRSIIFMVQRILHFRLHRNTYTQGSISVRDRSLETKVPRETKEIPCETARAPCRPSPPKAAPLSITRPFLEPATAIGDPARPSSSKDERLIVVGLPNKKLGTRPVRMNRLADLDILVRGHRSHGTSWDRGRLCGL